MHPPQKRSSLKLSLVLPFVTLIALLTGALGVLWYWTGSKTVSTLSQQLMTEMAGRIAQTIEWHLRASGTVLDAANKASITCVIRFHTASYCFMQTIVAAEVCYAAAAAAAPAAAAAACHGRTMRPDTLSCPTSWCC